MALRWHGLEVTGGFLLLMAFLLYAEKGHLLLPGIAACIFHELGHYCMIRACGGRVVKLRLSVMGAEMALGGGRMLSYGKELLCTLAGPVSNFLLALIAGKLGISLWAGMNLVLGCFHLLPVLPLDGGRALKLLLCILWDEERALRGAELLSKVLAGGLLAAGAAQAWYTKGNLTLLIVGIWIFSVFGRQKDLSTLV